MAGVEPTGPNEPPVAGDFTTETLKNTALELDLLAHVTDPDGIETVQTLELGDPEHGSATLDPGTGLVTYEPEDEFVGEDCFDYVVIDSHGVRDTGRATIGVKGISVRLEHGIAENAPVNSMAGMIRSYPPEAFRDFEILSASAIPVGEGDPVAVPTEWFSFFHQEVVDTSDPKNPKLIPESGNWTLVWDAPLEERPSHEEVSGFSVTVGYEVEMAGLGVATGPQELNLLPDVETPEDQQRWFQLHIYDDTSAWYIGPIPANKVHRPKIFRASIFKHPEDSGAGNKYQPEIPDVISEERNAGAATPWIRAAIGEILDLRLDDADSDPSYSSRFCGFLHVRGRIGGEDRKPGALVPTFGQEMYRRSWCGGEGFVMWDYTDWTSLQGTFRRFMGSFFGSYMGWRDQDWHVYYPSEPAEGTPERTGWKQARVFFTNVSLRHDATRDGEIDEADEVEEDEKEACVAQNADMDSAEEGTYPKYAPDLADEEIENEDDREDLLRVKLMRPAGLDEMLKVVPSNLPRIPLHPHDGVLQDVDQYNADVQLQNNMTISIGPAEEDEFMEPRSRVRVFYDGPETDDLKKDQVVLAPSMFPGQTATGAEHLLEPFLDNSELEEYDLLVEGVEPGRMRLESNINVNGKYEMDRIPLAVVGVEITKLAGQKVHPRLEDVDHVDNFVFIPPAWDGVNAPRMPLVSARLVPEGIEGEVDWDLKFVYRRRNRDQSHYAGDQNPVSSGSLSASEPWDLTGPLESLFRGGEAIFDFDLELDGGATIANSLWIGVKGVNPSDAMVELACEEERIASMAIDGVDHWYAIHAFRHESRMGDEIYNQFNLFREDRFGRDDNSNPTGGFGNYALHPNRNDDLGGQPPNGTYGWGITQQTDYFNSTPHDLVPANQLWNWRENLRAGFEELREKYRQGSQGANFKNHPPDLNPLPAITVKVPGGERFFTGDEARGLDTLTRFNGGFFWQWNPDENRTTPWWPNPARWGGTGYTWNAELNQWESTTTAINGTSGGVTRHDYHKWVGEEMLDLTTSDAPDEDQDSHPERPHGN